MSYTKEEIERKRQLALERAQQAQLRRQLNSSMASSPSSVRSANNANNVGRNVSAFGSPNQTARAGSTSQKASPTVLQPRINGSTPYTLDRDRTRQPSSNRIYGIESNKFFGQANRLPVSGHCRMISNDRFAVETTVFRPSLVEVMKTVPSRMYDLKTRTWNFLLKDYETLMEKLIEFKSDVQISGLPKTVLEVFRKAQTEPQKEVTDEELLRIDPTLVNSLMPFQREGVCYGISKGGRCMIADDMGLGKTIQALGIAHYFSEDWPLLIVTPSSVKYSWSDAIYKFLPSVPAQHVYHFANAKSVIGDEKIVITSYDLLARALPDFVKRSFQTIIFDESHVLKCVKTARFKSALRVTKKARHVILLTGTPALSRPMELYSQISLIVPHFMGFQEYGVRYCEGKHSKFGWNFTGSSNTQELQLLLKHCCVIRRVKADVMSELPEKKREIIILDQRLVKHNSSKMISMSKRIEQSRMSRIEKHNALLHYYHASSYAKLKAICKYVTDLFESKTKCLVFAHHQHLLKAITKRAEQAGIKFIRIDGKTGPEQRNRLVDKFQTRKDCTAAILSITAANAGITLTAAQLVVFTELFWNPGVLCQAEDRVHRIGQQGNVVIRYLVAKQTADDYLWPLIQRKMQVLNMVGLDQDFSLSVDNVTNQKTDKKKQGSIDSFLISSQSPAEEEDEDEDDDDCDEWMEDEGDESMDDEQYGGRGWMEEEDDDDESVEEEEWDEALLKDFSLSTEELEKLEQLESRETVKLEQPETRETDELGQLEVEEFDFGDWDDIP